METSRTTPGNTRPGSNTFGDVAEKAADDLKQRAQNAAAAIDQSRSSAADGLETAASAIQNNVDGLPGGEKVRQFARATADRLSTGADYVRSHDARRMRSDVESLVKSNPGPALVASAMFGFLLARALSRD